MILKKSKKISPRVLKKSNSQSGFTMLEMALIIVIGGILLSFMGAALLTFLRESQTRTTEYRLDRIKESLGHYLSVSGRYPCAADRTLGALDSSFGREVTSDCDSGSFSGTVRVNSAVPGERVRIGAVPTRTLNLPDEFVADAWGRKFTYAITEDLATNQQYRADKGRIIVKDDADANMLTDVHFIVISHGATGEGAFPIGASTLKTIPCPAAVSNSLEQRNCDDTDAVFRSTLVNAEPNLVNFYDDYVVYQNRGSPLEFPTGAIVPFTTASCPDGWTDYTRANGAVVVGASSAPLVLGQFVVRSTGNTSFNLSVGSTNQKAISLMPPSLALKYCEKLP